jgi:outer membrane protein W
MRRMAAHVSTLALATGCLAMAAAPAAAQAKGGTGSFSMGYTDIGPTVGLGNLGSAGASFGGRFEHAIKPLPDLGNGMLGIQVGAEWYSWSNAFYSYTYIPFGVTANYHFKLDEPKLDPFVGLGLGYQIINCTVSGVGNVCANSALYFIGRAGARYFFAPNMAAYGDVGAGAATLSLGIMFKLK